VDQEIASPPPPNPFRANLWPLLLAATIVAESSRRMPEIPGSFPGFDKVVHFAVYGLLATLTLRAPKIWRHRWRAVLAVALVSFFGATDEWHQLFTPGRSCDILDWLADTAGAALAVALYLRWPAYRRVLEAGFAPSRPRARPSAN
jgi:VanZ family protein